MIADVVTEFAPSSSGSSASTADSKSESASTRASTADSKAVSVSTVTSTADSKALSVSTLTSIADSKAVSVSLNTSIADSKAVSSVARTLDIIPAPVAAVNFNGQQATTFLIENRTSDPGSPSTGQFWLRTDL